MTVANVEKNVRERYSAGAQTQVVDLCCPVDYDPQYLEIIPAEVIERDYGCGDPSKHLRPGETVLDLGSGTGKICFIASQVVGAEGRVIGVDMTPDMLDVARRNAPLVAEKTGFANVEFRRGRIQDLALDLERLDGEIKALPIDSVDRLIAIEERAGALRRDEPMIVSDSIDAVVSNCVLNLVETDLKEQLFSEIYRVLNCGGRAVISDIVSDEDIPQEMVDDPELWSGCISGAMTETGFIEAFERAGFHGIRILEREVEPWQTVNGIEFRSLTVEAFKGKEGPCWERNQAVVYKGPFKEVLDDDGHRMERGVRYAVCDKTFKLYQQEPYSALFDTVEPLEDIPLDGAAPFDCSRTVLRHPQETKGEDYDVTKASEGSCCSPGECC